MKKNWKQNHNTREMADSKFLTQPSARTDRKIGKNLRKGKQQIHNQGNLNYGKNDERGEDRTTSRIEFQDPWAKTIGKPRGTDTEMSFPSSWGAVEDRKTFRTVSSFSFSLPMPFIPKRNGEKTKTNFLAERQRRGGVHVRLYIWVKWPSCPLINLRSRP